MILVLVNAVVDACNKIRLALCRLNIKLLERKHQAFEDWKAEKIRDGYAREIEAAEEAAEAERLKNKAA